MKNERQKLILQILQLKNIDTQQKLVQELRAHGNLATQATVSRDIKELQLIKVAVEGGGYRYAEPEKREGTVSSRMIRILSDSMVSVNYAGNLVVVKTLSGSANIAGEVIDSMEWPEIIGTIAGDNTIMIVVRDEGRAAEIAARIRLYAGSNES